MIASARRGAIVLMALLVAGCGAQQHHTTQTTLAAAEPGHDPRASGTPAGHSVKVGADPQGIAVAASAGLVAVGVHSPTAAIDLLSATTGRFIKRVPIAGAPRHLAVAGPAGPVLVPEERRNRLTELTLPSGKSRSFVVGHFPHAVTAVDGEVWVGNERGGTLSEILPSGRVRRITGFTQPGGLAPVGQDIAVVDVAKFTLSLLDRQTDKVVKRLPAGQGPTHDAADGGRIYVLDTRGDAVLTYTASPFRMIGRTPVAGSPYGIAVDPVRHRLWVTETSTNRLAELTLTGQIPRIVRTYATGAQPDTVAVDTATGDVFVANQTAATVQMITPGS